MKVGYVRVSSKDQNTLRQEVLMQSLGVEKVYIEKESGIKRDRPELNSMLSFLREGDELVVEAISRLARSARDLLEITDKLKEKGVEFISKKEAIDTNTPTGKFMLTVFAAISELERDQIKQRQREGIDLAMSRGMYKGRPKKEVIGFEEVYAKWKAGEITATKAWESLGIKKNTFYRRVKEIEE